MPNLNENERRNITRCQPDLKWEVRLKSTLENQQLKHLHVGVRLREKI
jgi:hypothetical protein